ncbi:hypothetical protein VNO80_08962 [Phaseolus coccineus]|uniref:Uncharacterized protein n=1 Tax=Phaseolus coccineus TaxID=3886 RepID=A0AAN9NAJ7_PHACN
MKPRRHSMHESRYEASDFAEPSKFISFKGKKRRECEKINEMLSMKEIHRGSKLCPSCDMVICRTEGCNKMKCGICYRCNKAIDPSDPYGHSRILHELTFFFIQGTVHVSCSHEKWLSPGRAHKSSPGGRTFTG